MTGKPEEPGFDPETVFNEGRELGISEAESALREQIGDMVGTGMQPDEIEQALFGEGTDVYAPRRGKRRGKINCSARQRATMPQICKGGGGSRRKKHTGYGRIPSQYRRTYDPAPVGGYRAAAKRYYKKKGGAKGLVTGLKPLILPGATLATIYSKYQERAVKLKAAGALNKDGTPVDGVWQALMYDWYNRPATTVWSRVQANSSKIVVPMIAGGLYKGYLKGKIKLHPKVNQVVDMGAEAAIGMGIGSLINAILDPPMPVNQQVNQPIQVVQPARIQVAPVNSYVTPGGYY